MSQLQHIATFNDARLNLDKNERYLAPNEFRKIHNLWAGVLGGEESGAAEAMLGNTLVGFIPTPKAGTNNCIGTAADIKNNAIVYFIYNSAGDHGIYRLYLDDDRVETILVNSLLNFQLDHKIYSAFIVDDLLYWTDGYEDKDDPFSVGNSNPPRKINLTKAYNFTNKEYATAGVGIYEHDTTKYIPGEYVLFKEYIFKCRFTSLGNYPPSAPKDNTWWEYIEKYDVDNNYLSITKDTFLRIKAPPVYAPQKHDGDLNLNESGAVRFNSGYGSDAKTNSNYIASKTFYFKYRYVYDDKEVSVWSDESEPFFVTANETAIGISPDLTYVNNVIALEINAGPAMVKRIDIAARISDGGDWRLYKTYYKYNEDGGANIDNNETGHYLTSGNTYIASFYNDNMGSALNQEDVSRPFDYIPQISAAEELIKDNRIVDANYISGYDNIDTDISLSMSYEKMEGSDIQFDATVNQNTFSPPYINDYFTVEWDEANVGSLYSLKLEYFEYTSIGYTNGPYYYIWEYIALPGDDLNAICEYFATKVNEANYFSASVTGSVLTILSYDLVSGDHFWYASNVWAYRVGTGVAENTFKSFAWYKAGLVYHGEGGRYGNVNAGENNKIFITPYQDGKQNVETYFRSIINWEINHTPPKWATHYEWVMTRSNISWFTEISILRSDIQPDDDDYHTNIAFNDNIQSIIDYKPSTTIPLHEYQKGDRLRIIAKRDPESASDAYIYYPYTMDFEIIDIRYETDAYQRYQSAGDDAEYILDENGRRLRDEAKANIIVKKFDIDGLVGDDDGLYILVQVYRPANNIGNEENELYFTIGEKFEVGSPHTEARYHKAGNGVSQDQLNGKPAKGQLLNGDVFIKQRYDGDNAYLVESMEYSDYYKSTTKFQGNPNLINRNQKRKRFQANLLWSGRFIQDSLINELSRVNYNDYEIIDEKYGAITHIQDNANVLKVRQERKCTNIYLGRAALRQAEENNQDVVAVSNKVLGYQYQSKMKYGCADAESCIYTGRYSYFVDIYNGLIIRDAPNGLYPISEYGIKKWVMDKCKYLLEDCDEYRIQAAYEPEREVVIFIFAGLDSTTKQWTTENKMFTDKDNKWVGSVDLKSSDGSPVDWFGTVGDIMVGWDAGRPYIQFNNPIRCNFFGTQYYPSVKLVVNNQLGLVKVFRAISIHSNKVWEAPDTGDIFIPATVNYPYGMQSRLKRNLFKSKEGIHYAAFRKNMVNLAGSIDTKLLYDGQELRGNTMDIDLTNTTDTGELILNEIIINSTYPKRLRNG